MENRNILEKEILGVREVLARRNELDKVEHKLMAALKDYMTKEKISQFLLDLIPINALEENELFYFTDFFIKNKYTDLKIEEFYSEEEMANHKENKISFERMYDGDKLVVKDALMVKTGINEQFVTTLTYKQIAQLFEEGVVNYNFATQRKGKPVRTRGKIIRTATINIDNVNSICRDILDNKFESNMITLNIWKTGDEDFKYNEHTKELSINRSKTILDVIDGYHRTKGINLAWKKNPRIDGSMIICIKNLTVAEARLFIWQEAKGTTNNLDEMALYDMDSNIAKLISDINSYRNKNNILFNKISMESSNEDILIYYEIFAENLRMAWGKELQEADIATLGIIKRYICDLYSYMYAYIMNKLKVKKIEELEGTVALDQMFMCGILHLSRKMWLKYNNDIDDEVIEKIVNKLDLTSKDTDNKYIYDEIEDRFEYEAYIKAWEELV